jgi:hypothetical protein
MTRTIITRLAAESAQWKQPLLTPLLQLVGEAGNNQAAGLGQGTMSVNTARRGARNRPVQGNTPVSAGSVRLCLTSTCRTVTNQANFVASLTP